MALGLALAGFLVKALFLFIPDSDGLVWRIILKFQVEGEQNLVAWYSSSLLLFSAAVLGIIARLERTSRGQFVMHWAWLSMVFAYLSLDESASFHELMKTPMERWVEPVGAFRFGWVIPGMIAVVLFVLAYIPFLCALTSRFRLLFCAAGAIYVGGAVGMEMAGTWIVDRINPRLVGGACILIEETMEMFGIILFIYALLDFLVRHHPVVTFVFNTEAALKAAPGTASSEVACGSRNGDLMRSLTDRHV